MTIADSDLRGSGLTVSVLIPAFNARAFIEEALDSVAAQTLAPAEIIVVDDGSTDGTGDAVAQWAARTGRPVRLIQQANQGVSVARNRGMAEAGGNCIALLDADDIWLPGHVALLVAALEGYPHAVAALGDTVEFRAGTPDTAPTTRPRVLGWGRPVDAEGRFLLADGLFEAMLPGLFFAPTSSLFRRDAAMAAGGFDAGIRYIEDRDFFLRLARGNAFVFVDAVVSRSRVHDHNITHPKNAVRNAFYMLKLLRQLRADAARLALDERELALVEGEAANTVRQLLMAASSRGLPAYLAAVGGLLRAGEISGDLLEPRRLLRAAYRSLAGARGEAIIQEDK